MVWLNGRTQSCLRIRKSNLCVIEKVEKKIQQVHQKRFNLGIRKAFFKFSIFPLTFQENMARQQMLQDLCIYLIDTENKIKIWRSAYDELTYNSNLIFSFSLFNLVTVNVNLISIVRS